MSPTLSIFLTTSANLSTNYRHQGSLRLEGKGITAAIFHPSPLLFISAIPYVRLSFLSHFLPNSDLRHASAENAITSFGWMAQFPTKNCHINYVNTSGFQGKGSRKIHEHKAGTAVDTICTVLHSVPFRE